MFDPWHNLPVLARKPGALPNGDPFKDWPLPTGLARIRRKLAGSADGDRLGNGAERRVAPVLPDREAATVPAWLRGRSGVEIIARCGGSELSRYSEKFAQALD